MTSDELAKKSLEWVKKNHKKITAQFAGSFESTPGVAVSIFMAGSPGAGKTEFSIRLLEEIPENKKYIVRIDPDEIRQSLPQYIPGKAER